MNRRWPIEFVPDGCDTPEEAITHWCRIGAKSSEANDVAPKIRACQRMADGKSPYWSCGLDPSLTRSGMVIGDSADHFFWRSFASKPSGDDVADRIGRCESIAAHMVEFANEYSPVIIFVEDYARQMQIRRPNKNNAQKTVTGVSPTLIQLVELGGILRNYLLDVGRLVEVNIVHLKMFITGNHQAKKSEIKKSIDAKYDVPFGANHDAYDAFGLFLIGLCALGETTPTDAKQTHVMGKLGFTLKDLVEA